MQKRKKQKLCKVCKTPIEPRQTYCGYDCLKKSQKARKQAKNSVKLYATKRKTAYKTLKKNTWTEFSKYIRLKHASSDGKVKCVTCSKVDNYKKMQAGHFVAGRTNAILFNEELVHPQCYHCNIGLGGNYVEYFRFMNEVKGYSVEELYEFNKLRNTTTKISISEMENLYRKYQKLSEDLLSKLQGENNGSREDQAKESKKNAGV